MKRYFVAALKSPIFLSFLLNRIICEMNEFIVEIFKGKLFAGCPDISIIVPVAFHIAIHTSYEDIASDIEFSFLVNIRVFDVFLDEQGSLWIYVSTFYEAVNLFQGIHYNYAMTPI